MPILPMSFFRPRYNYKISVSKKKNIFTSSDGTGTLIRSLALKSKKILYNSIKLDDLTGPVGALENVTFYMISQTII